MSRLMDILHEKQLLISDGAWGTMLSSLGLPMGTPPEKWNLDHPDKVRTIPEQYFAAGSDIVLSNTFGGSRIKLTSNGLDGSVETINREGAAISKQCAPDNGLVVATMGPTGEFMQPLGTLSESDMIDVFAEQIKAFQAGGADAVIAETMTDLGEIRAAVKAARDNSDLPVIASMSFDKGQQGYATMMGVTPQAAAEALSEAGVDIVGSNCGGGIRELIDVCRLYRQTTDKPLWIKPNAGMPQLENGQTVYKETPEDMAAQVSALIEAGASVIGGCCGTTPDHIRAIAEAVRQHSA